MFCRGGKVTFRNIQNLLLAPQRKSDNFVLTHHHSTLQSYAWKAVWLISNTNQSNTTQSNIVSQVKCQMFWETSEWDSESETKGSFRDGSWHLKSDTWQQRDPALKWPSPRDPLNSHRTREKGPVLLFSRWPSFCSAGSFLVLERVQMTQLPSYFW